ncbi:MAG: F0F1 ATP synthase subunit A [Ichthyobacteriaceae bacterium]|nr:F0F1 ATP synthase subunit A [Ichthyobacteriaceae bacterium]
MLTSIMSMAEQEQVSHETETNHTETEAIHSGKEKQQQEIKDFVNHHLKDSHDFSLYNYTNDDGEKEHIGIPLPIILIDAENGVTAFMSSEFQHGKKVVEVNGKYLKLYHEKIYYTDADGTINYDENHHATNKRPYDFSITKSVVMILVTSILMFILFRNLALSYAKNGGVPTGAGRFFEPIIIYIRDEIAIPNIGEKHYKKYMSYLLTVFFFVWFLNMTGLTPLGVNVTGNITVTLALALFTYFITTFTANKNYWSHIFWMPGVPKPMRIILAPIELLGTIIKPFSLMIRLYANMVAGHVVLMSIIGLVFLFKNWLGSSLSFGLAFALSILEVLVALLQAYIFTMLSALYFGSAVEEHQEEH